MRLQRANVFFLFRWPYLFWIGFKHYLNYCLFEVKTWGCITFLQTYPIFVSYSQNYICSPNLFFKTFNWCIGRTLYRISRISWLCIVKPLHLRNKHFWLAFNVSMYQNSNRIHTGNHISSTIIVSSCLQATETIWTTPLFTSTDDMKRNFAAVSITNSIVKTSCSPEKITDL